MSTLEPLSTPRHTSHDANGFTFAFVVPYKREDLFKELCGKVQLGVDPSVKLEVTKQTAATRGEGVEISLGCERTATFPDGSTVSELVGFEVPSIIRWRQLSSKRPVNMIGKDGALPEVRIELITTFP